MDAYFARPGRAGLSNSRAPPSFPPILRNEGGPLWQPHPPPRPRSPGWTPSTPSSGDLHVIIETPKGSRNKFKYDEAHGLFKLGGVLPAGAVFPFDFGFVPTTLGGDGDPLDVLLLMDEPAFAGCLVAARLIGVIEAAQTEEDGTTERNDRLIAVAAESRNHREVHRLISSVIIW